MLLCLVLLIIIGPVNAQQKGGAGDPLPSWNGGITKDTIIRFIHEVTHSESAHYLPPRERLAVFDNDGTLWCEKPLYPQLAFLFQRVKALSRHYPVWRIQQPFKAVLENDIEHLRNLEESDILKLVLATHAGMTQTEFAKEVKDFLIAARHPRFNVRYTELIYRPMLELVKYLQKSGFKVYISSGGGIDFIRGFSEYVYGIPREHVIGSKFQMEYQLSAEGPVLIRKPVLVEPINNNEGKPVNIDRHIGRKPVIAVGNSDGDLEMLRFTDTGKGRALMLLLNHDDPEREYQYDRGARKALRIAEKRGWTIISIKKDFKKVFAFEK